MFFKKRKEENAKNAKATAQAFVADALKKSSYSDSCFIPGKEWTYGIKRYGTRIEVECTQCGIWFQESYSLPGRDLKTFLSEACYLMHRDNHYWSCTFSYFSAKDVLLLSFQDDDEERYDGEGFITVNSTLPFLDSFS